jgi:ribosomal subunit interface protein
LRIQVTERQCQVPPNVRGRAEKRVAGLARYSPQASAGEIVFLEEGVERAVEVIVHIDGGEPIVARAADADFLSALNKVVDRIARQLRKQRERRTDHQAPPRRERVRRE